MKTIILTLSEEVYISTKRLAENEGTELTSFLAALIADEVVAKFKKQKGIKIRENLTPKEKGKLRRDAFIENLRERGE